MSYENDVERLKKWLRNMGYSKSLPSDADLKKLFSDGSGTFNKIMERIRPREEVRKVKENILIQKMQNVKQNTLIPKSGGSNLPKEHLQLVKLNQLKAELLEAESSINSHEKKLGEMLTDMKGKNICKMQLEDTAKNRSAKLTILQTKHENLSTTLDKITVTKQKLIKTMPNKFDKDDPTNGKVAYLKCLSDLQAFYDNKDYSKDQQTKLYDKIRSTLENVPNCTLFNELLSEMEQLLQKAMVIKNDRIDEKSSSSSNVDYQISKLCARHLSLFVDLVAIKKERNELLPKYCQSFTTFSEMVNNQMGLVCDLQDEDEELIDNYISVFNETHFSEGKLELLTKEVGKRKAECEANAEKLSHHDQLISSIKDNYDRTREICNKIQEEIDQLQQVKEKLLYTKSCTLYMVKNIRSANKVPLYKTNSILPPYAEELKLLNRLQKFGHTGPIYLRNMATNPALISHANLANFPHHLLTLNGCLEEAQNAIRKDQLISPLTKDVVCTENVPEIDREGYEKKQKVLTDQTMEVIASLNSVHNRNAYKLAQCEERYDFIYNNRLKNFVPMSKKFNGYTYKQFESQFNMYYRMVYGDE